MNAGLSLLKQLRRGIRRGSAQLYVRRRTSKKGGNRSLVSLVPAYRYAICVWGSYRLTGRDTSFSAELHSLICDGFRSRLGENWEDIIEAVYEEYGKECADKGVVNIFETQSK